MLQIQANLQKMLTPNLVQDNRRRPTQRLMTFPKDSADIAIRVKIKKTVDSFVALVLAVDHVALFTLAAFPNGANLELERSLLVDLFNTISKNSTVKFARMSILDILKKITNNMNFFLSKYLREII